MPLDQCTRVGLELELGSVLLLALVVEEPVRVSVPSHDPHEQSKKGPHNWYDLMQNSLFINSVTTLSISI